MELELKKKTLKVTIYGEVFENVRVPTVIESEQMEEDINGKSGREISQLMRNYLEGLGIPKAALEKLDQDDFLALVRFVGNPKKK